MPEGCEISHMGKCLDFELKSMTCYSIVFLKKIELYSSIDINQYLIKNDQYSYINFNSILNCVTTKGKKIIFDFGNIRFVSSCLMSGRWTFTYSDKCSIALCFYKDSLKKYVYFYETRFGGNFSICNYPSNEYNHIFKDVGPDLLSNEVDYNLYYNIIKNNRISYKKICEFMLEQKYLSGIGNWLRAEILYFSRINPHRSLNSLSDNDITVLFYYTKKIMSEGLEKRGMTIESYEDPYGNKGLYIASCYGKEIDDYGNKIITELDKTGRKIHWCPSIQT